MSPQQSRWGRSDEEWDELASAADDFLRDRARLGRLTSYTELNTVLAQRTGQSTFDFSREDGRAAVGHLLGLVVRNTFRDEEGRRLMLSALVVYLGGNDAGSGFYTLAAEMGLLTPKPSAQQKDAFWTGQLNAIFAGRGQLP